MDWLVARRNPTGSDLAPALCRVAFPSQQPGKREG
jgi:hypothetical protein